MTATQAMTGQGGWPMTVFMTPDREPFFCGTYFPRPQFQRLVLGVARAWREDRDQVSRARPARSPPRWPGRRASRRPARGPDGTAAGQLRACDRRRGRSRPSGRAWPASSTPSRGGFGGAPKFPPSMVLEFLLRYSERVRPRPDGAQALADGRGYR